MKRKSDAMRFLFWRRLYRSTRLVRVSPQVMRLLIWQRLCKGTRLGRQSSPFCHEVQPRTVYCYYAWRTCLGTGDKVHSWKYCCRMAMTLWKEGIYVKKSETKPFACSCDPNKKRVLYTNGKPLFDQ